MNRLFYDNSSDNAYASLLFVDYDDATLAFGQPEGALVAVSLGAGFACVAMSQNPEVGSSYTLKSWQNPARQIRQIIGQFTKAA